MSLSDNFRLARETAGHTQMQAATKLKISLTTIQDLEGGRREPKHRFIVAAIHRYIKKFNPELLA